MNHTFNHGFMEHIIMKRISFTFRHLDEPKLYFSVNQCDDAGRADAFAIINACLTII